MANPVSSRIRSWLLGALVLVGSGCAAGGAPRAAAPARVGPEAFATAGSAPPASAAAAPDSDLARAISAIVDTGALARAHWGMAVYDVASGVPVFERNAERLFSPASTLKLVVSAAAAHHLGEAFRYRTELLATGAVSGGVLRGDLVVKGTGDPLISGRNQAGRTAIFAGFADSLRVRGVSSIEGGIIADVSHWPDEPRHGDWERYDLNWWYAAATGPLGFNDNSIDFEVQPGDREGQPARVAWAPETRAFTFSNRTRTVAAGRPHTLDFDRVPGTDSVFAFGEIPLGTAPRTESFAIRDPARYAATVLAETLAAAGIAIDPARVQVTRTPPASARPLFTYHSPPLPQVLLPILQTSQNWFAEQLAKTLGHEVRGEGSWRAGLEVERDFLSDVVGIDTAAFRLRDASGLSGGNLIAPAALARLVRYLATAPGPRLPVQALPASGGPSGSLRARLTDLPGQVRAKTGSIRNVATLAGLVRTTDGRELAFSIMANGTGLPASRVNTAIDAVVRVLARSAPPAPVPPASPGRSEPW